MARKKITSTKNNTQTAFIFLGLVVVFILLSLFFRLVALIQKSTFDGNHRFTVVLQNASEKRKTYVVSADPPNAALSLVILKDSLSVEETGKIVGIPIDGTLVSNSNNFQSDSGYDLFNNALTHYPTISTNLTIIDILRLRFFLQTVSPSAVKSKEVSKTNDQSFFNKLAQEFFLDSDIANEKASIQIRNASEISGLGYRLGRVLSNTGANVIAITTENEVSAKSTIEFYGKKTYTISRIEKWLGFETKPLSKPALSDIILTIGTDSAKIGSF